MRKILLASALILVSLRLSAQDDLLNTLERQTAGDTVNYTKNTFKGTRLINGHTAETRTAGSLVFLITHRFGELNSGAYNLFGLDIANIRFGFDYAITDRLTAGIGRSSFDKVYDGFLKYKLTRQSTGLKNFPFTTTVFASTAITTLKPFTPGTDIPFSHKLDYVVQALVARKFSEDLSLQLMPTFVHHNYVETLDQVNDQFAIGVGGRYKLTRRMAILGEYYYRLNGTGVAGYYNSLSVGFEVETGGHVFQIMLTNSNPMIEKGFITETTGSWKDGGIHLGFNISRVFYLKKYEFDSSDWQ